LRRRDLVPILLASALTLGPASVAAAREPTTGGFVRWTPIDPATLPSRATVVGSRALSPSPFRVAAYDIRTLRWQDLPHNGLSLLSLSPPANGDAEGIPYKVVGGRNYYSPGNIASQGVRFVDDYVRTGNPAYLDRARVRAKKLREIGIRRDGALFLPYTFDYPNERLTAPWVSAYSQGIALSLFVRLYRATGEFAYVDTAHEVYLAFRRLGPGPRLWVDYVVDGDLWLEEYPSSRPSHVLNGYNFALFGLYDYERLTRDPAAHQLLEGALSTMRRKAAAYRVPGELSYYDLVHKTQWPHYHEIHVWQLRNLTAISGDPYFDALADKLAADYP
jgi:hypothetical protein